MNMNRSFAALVLTAIFAAATIAQHSQVQATSPAMSAEKWREDLRFMAAEIEKTHKNAFHRVSRDQFYKEVNALEQRIPSLEDHQVVAEFIRIVAMVGDGHTGLRWGAHLGAAGVLPVRFYQFDDGIFVQNALPEHKSLLGAKLVAVNGVPVAQAVQKMTPYTSGVTMNGGLRPPLRSIYLFPRCSTRSGFRRQRLQQLSPSSRTARSRRSN